MNTEQKEQHETNRKLIKSISVLRKAAVDHCINIKEQDSEAFKIAEQIATQIDAEFARLVKTQQSNVVIRHKNRN